MNKKNIVISTILITSSLLIKANYDLTIIGDTRFCGSLLRFPITVIDMLKDNLKINIIRPNQNNNFIDKDVTPEILKIINNHDTKPGKVSLLLSCPSSYNHKDYIHALNSDIKIAYTMTESTEVPKPWVKIFNDNFDLIVVPDKFLIDIYKNSGVTIPIFSLAFPMYLDEFLNKKPKKSKNKIFTFGTSSSLIDRKNHETVIKAFANEFGNNPDFKLKIHGRFGDIKKLQDLKNNLKINNIELIIRQLNHEQYIDFLTSLDCYILVSKSEGFSLTPREALALSIPCIISNNSGHKTISKTDLVRSVKSEIQEPYHYGSLFNEYIGYCFNCEITNVQEALLDVYNNYDTYLKKALTGRSWVQKYDFKKLSGKFLSLIKPQKIILGDKNTIKEDYLMTNSESLYNKFKKIHIKT